MRNINEFKKFFVGGLTSVLVSAVLAVPILAVDGGSLSIPVSTVVRGDADSTRVLSEKNKPETLSKTGIGGILSGVFGAGAIGTGLKSWLESRSMLRNGVLGKDK